jgi:hypothetical protein
VDAQVDDSLQSRMIRAARLDSALYDEVKADPRALPQASFVVVLSALATGIGFGQGDLETIGLGTLFALFGWAFTAYLAHFIGTRLLPEPKSQPASTGTGLFPERRGDATPAALLRTLGFSNAPGIVRMLAVVPELTFFVMVGTTLWMLCASVIAIRQGLSYQSTLRAAGVYAAIQLLLVPLILLIAAGEAPGPAGAPGAP